MLRTLRTRDFLIIFIVIVLCECDDSARQLLARRSGRDYIIHTCIATADLSTKDFKSSLLKRNSKHHSPNKTDVKSLSREDNARLKLPNKRTNHGRRIGNNFYKVNLLELNVQDTPLKTIRIEPIHKNKPSIFTRKDPLPEAEDFREHVKEETRVIVVQSLN